MHGTASLSSIHDEPALGRAYDARLVRRLWPHVRKNLRLVAGGLALVPVVGTLNLVQPYFVKQAIDVSFAGRDVAGLAGYALLFAAALFAEYAAAFVQSVMLDLSGQRSMRDLRVQIFAHLQTQDESYFATAPVGRLLTRLTSDVEAIGDMFAAGAVALLCDAAKLAGIVVILFYVDWRLAAISFCAVPVLFAAAVLLRRMLREAYRDIRARLAAINSMLNETLGGIAVVQAFVHERNSAAEFARRNDEYTRAGFRTTRVESSLYAMVEMVASFTLAAILWYGGARKIGGGLTFGTLVAFIEWMNRFFAPLRDISAKYTVMQSAMAGAERIFAVLDERPRVGDPPAGTELGGLARGIELSHVSFAYRPGEAVLEDVSLFIPRGERVALVGATGAGKTTLLRLLNRLYDPTAGVVRIDGVDLREASLSSVRRRFAVVPQETFLFSGSVLDNVTLSDERVGVESARRAASAVGLDEVLARRGLDLAGTIGERGQDLSAGERQLLALARALAADPEVLILDEATASVDPHTEELVRRGIERVLAGRTSITVAHRLSTVRNADRIVVLARGRVREQGSHDELLARDGIYRRLYELQFAAPR